MKAVASSVILGCRAYSNIPSSYPIQNKFFFRSTQNAFRDFLFSAANLRQTLGIHLGIKGTLVVVCVNHNIDLVVVSIKQGNSPTCAEYVIIRVRRK